MKSLKEIEAYAQENYIPIARKETVAFLKEKILLNNYQDVLEIGSAIGYTTIQLALLENVYVTTIEYDEKRHEICLENIRDFQLEEKVSAILDDALEIFLSTPFDLIFIDAAKAKNIAFFEKFSGNLRENGMIVIDNLLLKDFQKMANPQKVAFYRQILADQKKYLDQLKGYDVQYLNIGDGMAIIQKRKEK